MASQMNQGAWQFHNQGAWQNIYGIEAPTIMTHILYTPHAAL